MTDEIEVGSPEWHQLVADVRKRDADRNWRIGDAALRIVPIEERTFTDGKSSGQPGKHDGRLDKLRRFAEEAEAASYGVVLQYRHCSHAWPQERREPTVSHRAHRELMSRPDRFTLIRPGMTLNQASEAAGKSTSARGGRPGLTLLSLIAELTEIKRRVRETFRATVTLDPGPSGKDQLLAELADVETEIEQYRLFLAGMGVNEAIEKIMEGT